MCVRTYSVPKGTDMSRLLHISASPRGAASESLALGGAFEAAFAAASPEVEIDHFDLWDGTLPTFGRDAAGAKMAAFAGEIPTDDQAAAWRAARATFLRFDAADRYLFTVPMWNAGIPYILKQFIDVVSQPGWVFGFDAEIGYSGLLRDKKAVLIYTSAVYGEDRGPAFGNDFQAPYLRDWLAWAGVKDINEVAFRPNLAVADPDPGCRAAFAEAVRIAGDF